LIPKNHKLFIKPTAEETKLSEVLVTDTVEFFYSELRKLLNEIQSINIKVDRLGTFKVKYKTLGLLKTKLETQYKGLDNPESFNKMRVKKEVQSRLEKVKEVHDLMQSERERKNNVKQKRNEETKRNLEE
jgi:nucleoid DNA-binding protein